MKVLAISSYGRLGGAELAMSTFLSQRPSGVDAAALVIGPGELADRLTADGVATWRADRYDGRPSPGDLARFPRGLGALTRQLEPDVLWAVGLKAAIMSRPSLTRVPLVWHKVDFTLDEVLAKPLAAVVDGVIAVSNPVASALGRCLTGSKLLGVVGPPVALDQAIRARPDPALPLVGTLGALTPIKGHHHLIRAVAQLIGEFPRLRLLIGGAPVPKFPSYPAELRALAAALGIGDRVRLLGFTDPATFLPQLSVYVSATYRDGRYGYEGLSGAMLEASWTGVPVVATRGGGTPDGVLDGVTGTLVDPGDPDALARAIGAYLSDPALARRSGDAGRAFARDRFAPRSAADALFGFLELAVR